MPYFQDDFTWCLQKAPKMLWLLSIMTALSPTVWVLVIFGYGYVSGFLLYLLIQFDEKYEQRNNRDWHYTTLLISLPSVIGTSQRFRPHSIKIRFIYAFFLIAMIFCNMPRLICINSSKSAFLSIKFLPLMRCGPMEWRWLAQNQFDEYCRLIQRQVICDFFYFNFFWGPLLLIFRTFLNILNRAHFHPMNPYTKNTKYSSSPRFSTHFGVNRSSLGAISVAV